MSYNLARVIWAMFCIGGCVYLIINYGWSPWWMLLAIILA